MGVKNAILRFLASPGPPVDPKSTFRCQRDLKSAKEPRQRDRRSSERPDCQFNREEKQFY